MASTRIINMNDMNAKVFWGVTGGLVFVVGRFDMEDHGKPAERCRACASGGGPVVAYGHGDSLQQGMALLQTMQANLQLQLDAREQQLQEDALPLQQEAQELLEYAQNGQASQDELEIAQTRILELDEELRAMQGAAEQDMFVAEQNLKAVLADALRRHLEAHAEEEGIDFILNWGLSGEGVLYGSEPWDITIEVLDRINKAHPDPIQTRLDAELNTAEE